MPPRPRRRKVVRPTQALEEALREADAPGALSAWLSLVQAGAEPLAIASPCAAQGQPLLEQAITHAVDASFRFIPPTAMMEWISAFHLWASAGVPLVLDGSTRHAGARLAMGVRHHADNYPSPAALPARIGPVFDLLALRLEDLGLPGTTAVRFSPGHTPDAVLARPSWGEVLAEYPVFARWSARWSSHALEKTLPETEGRGGRTRL